MCTLFEGITLLHERDSTAKAHSEKAYITNLQRSGKKKYIYIHTSLKYFLFNYKSLRNTPCSHKIYLFFC
jgi:hypothetical protein